MAKMKTDYREHVLKTMNVMTHGGGLLLAVKADNSPANAMTIGWGTIGAIWGKPIWSVLVRPSRHTYSLIESAGAFTVCVPTPALRAAVTVCGTASGRDMDKFETTGMTYTLSDNTGQPLIDGCDVIYDCKVVGYADLAEPTLSDGVRESFYGNGDYHRIYHGEIVGAWEDASAPVV